ncbi:MAG: hypothetical protein WC750_02525 [Patescibacteria group bacterium]
MTKPGFIDNKAIGGSIMVDQQKFQALSKEWSALVDLFLETPDGKAALFTLQDGEGRIFTAILKTYADALDQAAEIVEYFAQQGHGVFALATEELQENAPDLYSDEGLARARCEQLRDIAKDAAAIISYNRPEEPQPVAIPKSFSEIPISDDVAKVLDMASQPGFDVSCAIQGVDDSLEAERRVTRRAPDDEIRRIWASITTTPLADPPGDQTDVRTPVVEPSSVKTVPTEDAELGDIRTGNLNEVLRRFSQAPYALDPNTPPVSVSDHPASPPPAPKPGVALGIESSIPPPPDDDEADDVEIDSALDE